MGSNDQRCLDVNWVGANRALTCERRSRMLERLQCGWLQPFVAPASGRSEGPEVAGSGPLGVQVRRRKPATRADWSRSRSLKSKCNHDRRLVAAQSQRRVQVRRRKPVVQDDPPGEILAGPPSAGCGRELSIVSLGSPASPASNPSVALLERKRSRGKSHRRAFHSGAGTGRDVWGRCATARCPASTQTRLFDGLQTRGG